ncbi:reverse transcriptase [Elysia marginata]|uniref:Reverse transcriptase n=1 Tax=Elysia marginata TaxID=1093978 RepID=A0AAV4GFK3_9GAST|nr:reverse transcriptase [Elysia marginata]
MQGSHSKVVVNTGGLLREVVVKAGRLYNSLSSQLSLVLVASIQALLPFKSFTRQPFYLIYSAFETAQAGRKIKMADRKKAVDDFFANMPDPDAIFQSWWPWVLAFGSGSIYGLRQWLRGPKCTGGNKLHNKTIIVTGASSGIGKEIALNFANRGGTVVMACRDEVSGKQAADFVRKETENMDVYFSKLDLNSFKSIKDFVERFKKKEKKLDILVNNAGVMMCPQGRTEDGFDIQFQTNYLGQICLVLPRAAKSTGRYENPVKSQQLQSCTPQRHEFYQTILTGDFNGHSPLWGYKDHNKTGEALENISHTTNLIILQDRDSPPTLLHRAHNTLSRPDLTILLSDLHHKHNIQVLDEIGSDHLPILTTLHEPCSRKFEWKTRWNFKKANWSRFKETTDNLLTAIKPTDDDPNLLCSQITEGILKAAADCIPRGCRKAYKPRWNTNIEQAVKTRQEARKQMEKNPTIENKILYNKTSALVKRKVKTAKKEKWTKTCENLELRKDGAKAWSLLNNLNGEKRRKNPKPLSTGDESIVEDQKEAEVFNKYFSSVNKAERATKKDKILLRKLKQKKKAPGVNLSLFEDCFKLSELNRAMKKLKLRKSPGPDRLHNEMLLHLGLEGKKVLLKLINKTWGTSIIRSAWKTAIVTPILKKGKPAEDVKSYKPIHPTSCLGKLAERMINNRLYWWLESNKILNPNQAGFRTGQQTEDQLFRLSHKVIDGFQKKKNTTAVFVDLQQAYDRVWRKGLLWKMREVGIHGRLYQWVKYFLVNRMIQTKINNGISSKLIQEEGSSLSCTLFLIFINDLPDVVQTEKALYSDDLVMWHTNKHPGISARLLNEDLDSLQHYCDKWKLKINSSKTVYSVFTKSHIHVVAKKNIRLSLRGTNLKKEKISIYLGVKLDRQLALKEYIQDLRGRANKRLQLVKRLASTSWGADKNTLRQLYIGYVRSLMEYNLALQSISSKTNKDLLDRVQSQAVHFISGGMRSIPTAACEIHTNIEPLGLRRDAAVMNMVERYKK